SDVSNRPGGLGEPAAGGNPTDSSSVPAITPTDMAHLRRTPRPNRRDCTRPAGPCQRERGGRPARPSSFRCLPHPAPPESPETCPDFGTTHSHQRLAASGPTDGYPG